MGYRFTDLEFQQINKDGTTIGPALTFTPSTTPADVSRFAIGNRVRMTVTVEAYGTDTWTSKLLRFNTSLFGPTNGTQTNEFGFETNGFVTASAVAAIAKTGTDSRAASRQNFTATFQQSGTDVFAVIDFYLTTDVGGYISNEIIVNNKDRFILSRRDYYENVLENSGSSVYSILTKLGLSCRVFDYTGTEQEVENPHTGSEFWDIPFAARWYNSDYLGVTTGRRYMSSISITTSSQAANGLPTLTDATAATASGSVDQSFTVDRNQLSFSEMNTVQIYLNGYSHAGGTVSAIDDIRVLLLKMNDNSNNSDFNKTTSEAIIPTTAGGSTQIDGAIYTPTAWSQDLGTGQISVSFNVDGSVLEFENEYRILVNVYETANPERATAHLSPAMIVNYIPPIVPDIDGYLGTYREEYNNNELDNVAPHQRVRARLELDKTTYNAALASLGLTGSFDSSLFEVSAQFVAINGASSKYERYKPNTLTPPASNVILSDGMSIVTDSATVFSLAAVFRVEEERAGTASVIKWLIKLRQPTVRPTGFDEHTIQFEQILNVIDFENDAVSPKLVNIRFLDKSTYPATKTDILNLCNVNQFIAELEKDPALLTGSNNILATIYPGAIDGDTLPHQIEEEESWQPTTVILPQSVSGKIDSVETSFGADEFATWEINSQQLNIGSRYWVTGIVFDQVPDYCPIGLTAETKYENEYSTSAVSGWTMRIYNVNVFNEIVAHPDYVGNATVVYQRIVDSNGNLVGVQNLVGSDLQVLRIPPNTGTVTAEWRIDAEFDSGSGTHTVSHTLSQTFTIPVYGSGNQTSVSTAYQCTDLG